MEGNLWIEANCSRQQLLLGVAADEVVELPPAPPDESVFDVRAIVNGKPTLHIPAQAGDYFLPQAFP